jgi:hypothetical protein
MGLYPKENILLATSTLGRGSAQRKASTHTTTEKTQDIYPCLSGILTHAPSAFNVASTIVHSRRMRIMLLKAS